MIKGIQITHAANDNLLNSFWPVVYVQKVITRKIKSLP